MQLQQGFCCNCLMKIPTVSLFCIVSKIIPTCTTFEIFLPNGKTGHLLLCRIAKNNTTPRNHLVLSALGLKHYVIILQCIFFLYITILHDLFYNGPCSYCFCFSHYVSYGRYTSLPVYLTYMH